MYFDFNTTKVGCGCNKTATTTSSKFDITSNIRGNAIGDILKNWGSNKVNTGCGCGCKKETVTQPQPQVKWDLSKFQTPKSNCNCAFRTNKQQPVQQKNNYSFNKFVAQNDLISPNDILKNFAKDHNLTLRGQRHYVNVNNGALRDLPKSNCKCNCLG